MKSTDNKKAPESWRMRSFSVVNNGILTMNSVTQINVPFHNNELYLVEYDGQPYTPMKPIVEGMGLDWASQFTKLKQRFSKGIVEITIPSKGGLQTMICLLLRKLPAWLYSIQSGKVKPELRDTVIMYQNECDDVLWDYWTKGQAINSRKIITPEQQALLHEIVDRRSNKNRKIYAEIWSRHNRHFKIPRYSELLAIHFYDSVHYLETMEIKSKTLKPKGTFVDVDAVQNCHGVLQYRLIEYHESLEKEVKRLGGKMPEYPEFNAEQVVQALMSQILRGKKLMLELHGQGGFVLDLVPDNAVMIESNKIPELVTRQDLVAKEQLPLIMQNAMERLVK